MWTLSYISGELFSLLKWKQIREYKNSENRSEVPLLSVSLVHLFESSSMGHKSFILAPPVQLFQRIQVFLLHPVVRLRLRFLNPSLQKLNDVLLLPIILIKPIFQVSWVVDGIISTSIVHNILFLNLAVELHIGYLVGVDVHVAMSVVRCLVLNLLPATLLLLVSVSVASRPFAF